MRIFIFALAMAAAAKVWAQAGPCEADAGQDQAFAIELREGFEDLSGPAHASTSELLSNERPRRKLCAVVDRSFFYSVDGDWRTMAVMSPWPGMHGGAGAGYRPTIRFTSDTLYLCVRRSAFPLTPEMTFAMSVKPKRESEGAESPCPFANYVSVTPGHWITIAVAPGPSPQMRYLVQARIILN